MRLICMRSGDSWQRLVELARKAPSRPLEESCSRPFAYETVRLAFAVPVPQPSRFARYILPWSPVALNWSCALLLVILGVSWGLELGAGAPAAAQPDELVDADALASYVLDS
jgi:hypothetical protein